MFQTAFVTLVELCRIVAAGSQNQPPNRIKGKNNQVSQDLFVYHAQSRRTCRAVRGKLPPRELAWSRAKPQSHRKEGECKMEAYCVKCKAKKEMKEAKAVTMKNGKPATQGICPTCGTKMFKIGKA